MKTIFLSASRVHGVKLWSATHTLANNDDDPTGGATPVVLPIPATDEQIMASPEQPHRPWLIQGMKDAL